MDLSKSCHCKIIKIEKNLHQVVLTLRSTSGGMTGICSLEGFWINMKLAVDDTLHVAGAYDENKSMWYVGNEVGLVVFEPDFLVSSTAVVGEVINLVKRLFLQVLCRFLVLQAA